MAITFITGTPGSGMTYSGPHPLSVESVPELSIFYGWSPSPLPCVCCGEYSVKDNLCSECLKIVQEVNGLDT